MEPTEDANATKAVRATKEVRAPHFLPQLFSSARPSNQLTYYFVLQPFKQPVKKPKRKKRSNLTQKKGSKYGRKMHVEVSSIFMSRFYLSI